MKHSIPHQLDHALARMVTVKALESYQERLSKYSPEGTWVTEDRAEVRFQALGRTLKGQIDVMADKVLLDLEVPLMFRPFRSQAMALIEREIRDWIERAEAGEFSAPSETGGSE